MIGSTHLAPPTLGLCELPHLKHWLTAPASAPHPAHPLWLVIDYLFVFHHRLVVFHQTETRDQTQYQMPYQL